MSIWWDIALYAILGVFGLLSLALLAVVVFVLNGGA